jgi:hypothetical protein
MILIVLQGSKRLGVEHSNGVLFDIAEKSGCRSRRGDKHCAVSIQVQASYRQLPCNTDLGGGRS